MARPLRIEFPGAIYHVTCRMVGDWERDRAWLYRNDADRERFLDQLGERVEQFRIRLYLFVCMANHFHLVLETPEANCSRFMQSLLTAYTVYFNLRHDRHGHLFDGRYKARLVEGDEYLLALSRYVHLNPVRVPGMGGRPIEERIKVLRAYRWSSYPSYIGNRQPLAFVAYGPLLAEMAGRKRDWPRRYREFVEAGLAKTDEDFQQILTLSPRSIGGDGFRAWVDKRHRELLEQYARPEDVSFRHASDCLPAAEVLRVLGEVFGVGVDEFRRRHRRSPLRAAAARFLIRYAGQTQREVAARLGMGSGSAVNKQLATLPVKLADSRQLRRRMNEAAQRLELLQRDLLTPVNPPGAGE